MKHITILILYLLILNSYLSSQNLNQKDSLVLSNYFEFKNKLLNISSIKDEDDRLKELNLFWDYLKRNNKIPFVDSIYVAFLYRGKANKVSFEGDFSSWGRSNDNSTMAYNLPNTNLWYLEKEFPQDARLDYKIVVDGKWILDPNNPNVQLSGFGPNSELRMPKWKLSPYVLRDSTLPKGELIKNKRVKSNYLEYDLLYHIYLPYDYKKYDNLPVIYVTDGHEYMDDLKGSMLIVLDNLIAKKIIKPIIAVFIDPRDPDSLHINKRESQFLLNEKYLNFVCDELIQLVDKEYKTSKSKKDRAILGTSYGGVCATYFALMKPEVFNLIAIQSPAYWGAQKLEEIYRNAEKHHQKIFMSSGTINDGVELTRLIKNMLTKDGYLVLYKEVNEGHSWGNWRALLDDIFIYFWGI